MSFRIYFVHPPTIFILFLVVVSHVNCVPGEEIIDFDYSNGLKFSTDTILFDTVFTGIGSTTRRLKVYNPNDRALKISKIELGLGASSSYRIIVDGRELAQSEEIVLLGKDSILILAEVFIDPQDENQPYLVRDSIVFETNGKKQDIKLIAWGQDAIYLGNEVLACNARWSGARPYVLFSSVLVDTLCELVIEKGTRIFAAKNSYLYVKGSLMAEGTSDERIVFRNERLDAAYENIPGQWGGLVFLEGSHDNEINFSVIRNAQYGIRLGSPDEDAVPDIILKNTIIENISSTGILCFTSDLYAENVLVSNCLELIAGNLAGGNYTYRHCTFANYGFDFIRETPAIFISDNITLDDNSEIVEEVRLVMQNSIVEGNMDDELIVDLSGGTNSVFALNNSMFRTTMEELDTLGNILNEDPLFVDPFAYNFRLDTLSPAKDKGELLGIELDLDGNQRDNLPDLGAYERIE